MKNLYFLLVALFLCLVISSQSFAQKTVFEKLSGKWKGEGVVSGMESEIQMRWERVLSGKFYRLDFSNNMKGKNGTIVFEGTAFYKIKMVSETEGNWFDSFGFVRPIKALVESDKLTAVWGNKETEEGQTVYKLIEADKLEIVDSVKTKEGSWREFGRSTLTRIKD